MTTLKTAALAVSLLALSATVASAACTQDQLTGRWALAGSDNAKWVRCEFTVAPDGKFEGTCTGTNRPRRGNDLDGRIRVNADCKLGGRHRSGDQPRSQPLIGDLEEDGSAGSGILKFGSTEQNFGNLFTMTRKPER